MARPSMTPETQLGKVLAENHTNFLRNAIEVMVREIMEVEVSRLVGAGLHERSDERDSYRNGYRVRRWDTRAGTINLAIPKMRAVALISPVSSSRAGARSRRCSA